jgi:serine/threonine protein kinase
MKIYNKKYKVLTELGQGAYGKINLAENLEHKPKTLDMDEDSKIQADLEKFVAIKKMKIDVSIHPTPTQLTSTANIRDRFHEYSRIENFEGNQTWQHNSVERCVQRRRKLVPGLGIHGLRFGQVSRHTER